MGSRMRRSRYRQKWIRMDEMGDEIIIVAIEILYGGLIQIDFKNTETGQTFRAFCDPKIFFWMIGESMQKRYEESMDQFFRDARSATQEEKKDE